MGDQDKRDLLVVAAAVLAVVDVSLLLAGEQTIILAVAAGALLCLALAIDGGAGR